MDEPLEVTRHATRRMASRKIPTAVLELVVSYGDARKARDGAQRLALSSGSLAAIKRDLGTETARRLEHFRRVCVVEAAGTIVTTMWASRPLFN